MVMVGQTNWPNIDDKVYHLLEDASRVNQEETKIRDARGNVIQIDGEPVFAKLSRREGTGRTRQYKEISKWKSENGEFNVDSSSAHGDAMHAGGTGSNIEIGLDIDDYLGGNHDGETLRRREIIIGKDKDSIYHVTDREQLKITRTRKVDADTLYRWDSDVPPEERHIEIGGEEISIGDDELADLPRKTRRNLKDRDLVQKNGFDTPFGIHNYDTTYIVKGGTVYQCDHSEQPSEIESDKAQYQGFENFMDYDRADPREEIQNTVVSGLTTVEDYVRAVQKGSIPEETSSKEMLDRVREKRDNRIHQHVFSRNLGDSPGHPDLICGGDKLVDLQEVQGTRVCGSVRFDNAYGHVAHEVNSVEDDVVSNVLDRYSIR